MDRHEILVDDRLDLGGLDETIEFLAPPSPGGAKNHEDGALTGRRLRLGMVEKGIGGRLDLRVRDRNAEQKSRRKYAKTRSVTLHASSILPSTLPRTSPQQMLVYACRT
jgi:hypothetical protein